MIYSVGNGNVIQRNEVPGACSSFGRAITPFRFGFFASSPQSAFKWGNPGPLLTKIIPPVHFSQNLGTPTIPYGETLASNEKGSIVIACSPFSSDNCLIIAENWTKKFKGQPGSSFFGISVALNPSGTTIATLSKGSDGFASIQLYTANGDLISMFNIPHNPPISLRDKQPYMHFFDDKHLVVCLYGISKMIKYKNTVNGWLPENPIEIPGIVVSQYDQSYITLSQDGVFQIHDDNFATKYEDIIRRNIVGSKFTAIVGGKNWFAALEDSKTHRSLHVYSSISSGLMRGLFVFSISTIGILAYIVIRSKIDISRLLARTRSTNRAKQV